MYVANSEASSKEPSLQINRHEVLAQLWSNAEWLDEQIHKKQLKVNGALRQRVYMVQVHSGVCKTLLSGLKDNELDELAREVEAIKEHLKIK